MSHYTHGTALVIYIKQADPVYSSLNPYFLANFTQCIVRLVSANSFGDIYAHTCSATYLCAGREAQFMCLV